MIPRLSKTFRRAWSPTPPDYAKVLFCVCTPPPPQLHRQLPMPRRILHIIDSLRRDGNATQMLLLCQGLARAGWDVHVVALQKAKCGTALRAVNPSRPVRSMPAEFAAAGIPVVELNRRWPLDPLADLALSRHVARLQPDVVHTWDSLPGLFGPIVNRKGNRPRIIAGEYHIRPNRPSWEWLLHRRFARHVDRFITNSANVREWNISHGLPAERFTIIPSGVACGTDFSPLFSNGLKSVTRRDEMLHELSLPASARLIGIVGALTHEKRVKDLIWAADLLRVLHDELRVLIIGDGPLREQLTRYASLASDLEHIQFLGERDDVAQVLPHLDVLWNASENIGQSQAILEAMAARIPVIASNTPTNRELVLENETGFLIPLGTRAGRAARARHTHQIFTDAPLAERLGAAARRNASERFDKDLFVQKYVELYAELT